VKQVSQFPVSFRKIVSMSLLAALSGCSFPVEQNCEKRLLNSLRETLPRMEYARTQLLFDFSQVEASKVLMIVNDGYAGSGPPSFQTCAGDCKQGINPASKTPVVFPDKSEIFVDGPSGPINTVISEACALESDGVWLKSVTYRLSDAADAEINKIAK
jgi:hypothetical protein